MFLSSIFQSLLSPKRIHPARLLKLTSTSQTHLAIVSNSTPSAIDPIVRSCVAAGWTIPREILANRIIACLETELNSRGGQRRRGGRGGGTVRSVGRKDPSHAMNREIGIRCISLIAEGGPTADRDDEFWPLKAGGEAGSARSKFYNLFICYTSHQKGFLKIKRSSATGTGLRPHHIILLNFSYIKYFVSHLVIW